MTNHKEKYPRLTKIEFDILSVLLENYEKNDNEPMSWSEIKTKLIERGYKKDDL